MLSSLLTPTLAGERIVVTGSGGVLGTAVKARLSQLTQSESFFPTREDCNLLDRTQVEAYFDQVKPTMIFHLAGRVYGVQGNMDFCGLSYFENALMNINVIEAARLSGVRKVVAAGTTAIYSDLATLPMKEDDFWLGAPHGSEAAYAHAKRGMLAQLEAYKAQYGMDFAYLILTNLYGPNDRFDPIRGHVVPSLVHRFCQGVINGTDRIDVWGDGSPTRDFLFSGDAANAFVFAAATGSGVYNVATGDAVPIRTLVETVEAVTGFKGELHWDTTKPLGQLQRSYDVSRLKSLGWRPETSLPEGISQTVEWYRANLATIRV